ncbi:uracil/xanthine transporter [Alicyclobacillus sp. SO9]|uniref:uracil/xanthine transporter n=1 Tax=Alicyclobacillus sp. SO9 TaxID=2665646 RepID=UPI0018E84CDB|nr:uracil/xanthine transporter [Alicyclobacillus sp. SO9]QQE77782.1 uracil/xanthine transporter [Alicyclobacillus sp. SO9]
MTTRSQFVTLFASLQWLGFMFANTVVIPLSTSAAFHLTTNQTAGVMAKAFILTGLACLLQVWLGHRFPLMEGQSGLWWGVILTIASLGASSHTSLTTIGGSLALGMLLGGVALVLAGLLGVHKVLNRLFTPVVMSVLLILLASKLIDIFFKGMLGMQNSSHVHVGIALLSVVIVVVVSILTIGTKGIISNFSILIGLSLGWVSYVLIFGSKQAPIVPSWQEIGQVFTWGSLPYTHGTPIDWGIVIAGIVTALLNTTNTIATLRAAEPLFETDMPDTAYRRSLVWSGVFTMTSGVFSQVPYAPYTSSIGFLRTTRILERLPFVVGAVLFMLMGLVPYVSGFFSTMPFAVGAAVLFVAYLQLFGSALQNIEGMHFNFRTIFRLAVPVLAGLAIQSMPPDSFSTLPSMAQSIVGNGMLMGILIALVLENIISWDKLD